MFVSDHIRNSGFDFPRLGVAQSELILTSSCGMRQEIWQTERLEWQVRELAKQYAREQTQLVGQVETLTGNMQQAGHTCNDIDQRILSV